MRPRAITRYLVTLAVTRPGPRACPPGSSALPPSRCRGRGRGTGCHRSGAGPRYAAAAQRRTRWGRAYVRLLTWGATPEEAACTYPGDELVHDPDGGATMATALPAPPERIWPWLVQMGGGRGGW